MDRGTPNHQIRIVSKVGDSLKLRRAMQARDVSQQEAASLARHDPLTGLPDRRLLKETIEQALRRGQDGIALGCHPGAEHGPGVRLGGL
jgi:PleD family two-component response regulator